MRDTQRGSIGETQREGEWGETERGRVGRDRERENGEKERERDRRRRGEGETEIGRQ